MEGNISNVNPRKTLLTSAQSGLGQQCFLGLTFDILPDMKAHHFLYHTEICFYCGFRSKKSKVEHFANLHENVYKMYVASFLKLAKSGQLPANIT